MNLTHVDFGCKYMNNEDKGINYCKANMRF